jgi:hypothetical protein
LGLGLDTATEIAMFGIAATQASKGISLDADEATSAALRPSCRIGS